MNEHDVYYYLTTAIDILMIFAPSFGFMAQIIKFRNMKSSQGFSKFLSFILLIANILRIYFWIGKRFPIPLLFQSIVSIFMQIFLLKECLYFSGTNSNNKKGYVDVSINNSKYHLSSSHNSQFQINPYMHKPISILDIKSFWNWPYLLDYIYFLLLFSLVIGFISNIFGYGNTYYVEILGIASASVEAVVAIPQIIQNFKNKNTESLSVLMILTWVIGDSIKTVYFFKTNSPIQLIACGIFQLSTDWIIVFQILWYYNNTKAISKEYERINKKGDKVIKLKLSTNSTEKTSLSTNDGDSSSDEFQV
jgi:hypothetical protein